MHNIASCSYSFTHTPTQTCTHAHTVLTPADDENHIDKHQFKVPFVCGARNLGEALRRVAEGAAMIRTKGEAGTGEGGGGIRVEKLAS